MSTSTKSSATDVSCRSASYDSSSITSTRSVSAPTARCTAAVASSDTSSVPTERSSGPRTGSVTLLPLPRRDCSFRLMNATPSDLLPVLVEATTVRKMSESWSSWDCTTRRRTSASGHLVVIWMTCSKSTLFPDALGFIAGVLRSGTSPKKSTSTATEVRPSCRCTSSISTRRCKRSTRGTGPSPAVALRVVWPRAALWSWTAAPSASVPAACRLIALGCATSRSSIDTVTEPAGCSRRSCSGSSCCTLLVTRSSASGMLARPSMASVSSSFSSNTVNVSDACLRYSLKSAESMSTGKRKDCSNLGSLPSPAADVSCWPNSKNSKCT
mmetsp:Transcript_19271/g.45685  ORF Transcript_19271/g.45685 Transcript_19271/m.45685 type:complete len:327 (-) Transcript_19271:63-1043(-)